MTDLDQLSRAVKDLEYRVRALEKAQGNEFRSKLEGGPLRQVPVTPYSAGWCECGRDVCRAPNCFSHKPDPMGR